MAARDCSSASVGVMVPARKASTSEQASSGQGWAVMPVDANGIGWAWPPHQPSTEARTLAPTGGT